jgi:hypothetical protein
MAAFLLLALAQNAPPQMDLRDALERTAGKLKYFPTDSFVYDRIEDRYIPKEWLAGWREAYGLIASGKGTPRERIALLRHTDPKVRTLALAMLYHEEDPKNLRHIASLLKDQAETLPNASIRAARTINSKPGLYPEEVEAQTVGQVAERMLRFALEPAGYQVGDLDKYIESRKDRAWASWYSFRFLRAYQGVHPFQKECAASMKALRKDIDRLPQPDRDWIVLYLAGQYRHVDDSGALAALISPAELEETGRRLGRERLMDLIGGKKINDDPDLAVDNRRSRGPMAIVVMRHATKWLSPRDAPALLAAEKNGPTSPWYAIAAAELQPENAEQWLREAMRRFGEAAWDRAWDRGELAAALWRIKGDGQLDYVVDWMYKEEGNRRLGQGTAIDIFADATAKMPAAPTKKLLQRIVADARYGEIPLPVLRQAILMANRHSKAEVVPWRDLYGGWTLRAATADKERDMIAAWRAKLRAAGME